ncbi:MAG: cysteine hydrolase [Dehalococcoidales bacterium]|nr:cysteine hydrolase [Dehalococcoidales bacterium]
MEITVPARPEDIRLDTDRTALVVVDMQNAFCKKGGTLDAMGMLDEAGTERVIRTDRKIIDACRRRGVRVIYLRMAYKPDLSNAGGPESPNYWKELALVTMREHPELEGKFLVTGSWDWEIIDELRPQAGDITVDKNRYSGFSNTELPAVLRTYDIKYLVFIGIATNVCVESTLRDAYFHDYFPVIVDDGCGHMGPEFTHQATMWNVASVFGWVTTSEELVKALG